MRLSDQREKPEHIRDPSPCKTLYPHKYPFGMTIGQRKKNALQVGIFIFVRISL